jgi:hypothetical protein
MLYSTNVISNHSHIITPKILNSLIWKLRLSGAVFQKISEMKLIRHKINFLNLYSNTYNEENKYPSYRRMDLWLSVEDCTIHHTKQYFDEILS